MDASDFGRYGSLSLLKRNDPTTVVASYPIDDAEVTLGRDPSCSIRLYYPSVSALHCKLVFNESTAFLVVLGTNGVFVDGVAVFPATAGASPTTVPLPNGSTLDVHKKRFRFAYPPKHLRPALLATPSPQKLSRHALRMSMIASANVFSPRPSADPRENLRVLQSPLKPTREDPEIVLVESNTPRVVEADKDLVILDEVTLPPPPIPAPVFTMPSLPMTPAPVNRPRNSLHRAVLIRSAQRAEMHREMWKEEERELDEVEEFITPVKGQDEEDEEMGMQVKTKIKPVSSWRKSLEAVAGSLNWPFRRKRQSGEQNDEEAEGDSDNDNYNDDEDYQDENVNEDAEGEHEYLDDNEEMNDVYPDENEVQETVSDEDEDGHEVQQPYDIPATPQSQLRTLGPFMTPQATYLPRPTGGRHSLGGTGPRRVRIVAPWKVEDIVVPPNSVDPVKEEVESSPEKSPAKDAPRGWETRPSMSTPQRAAAERERLTDEERKTIRERRRSAVTMPDTFFNGHAPGTLPPTPRAAPSPARFATPGRAEEEDEQGEEMHVLLARMREMVEGAKRRQSVGLSPQKPARDASLSPRKKGGFSLLAVEEDHSEDEVEERQTTPPLDVRTALRDRTAASAEVEAEKLSVPAPQTPQYAGLRSLFQAGGPNAQVMATPRMDGVKEMFLREAHVRQNKDRSDNTNEDALEGVGEMMQTPVGWRPSRATAEEPLQPEQEQREQEPQSVLPRIQSPALPADNPESHTVQAAGTRMVRRTRTRTAEDNKETPSGSNTGIPKPTRSLRSRTADAKTDSAATLPERPQSAPAKTAPSKKKTESGDEGTKTAPAPAAAAVRRTRRGVQSESESEDVPAPAPRTLRRTGRTKTPTPEPLPSTAARSKTSTGRRTAKSKQVEAEANEPELDAIPQREEPAPEPAPAAARVRRTARSRIPVGTIKEEVEDSPLPDAAEGSAASRTRGSRAAAAARTRASAKKAATPVVEAESTASGTADAPSAGDKENTPEPSGEDEAPPPAPAKTSTVRTKVTRAGARTRQGTEEQTVEKAPTARAAGVTRSGRALGKTTSRK
ncbi:hypothetical protein SCP_0505730 [Sparassis crispa]|uniref:FHA domain-containing protein n=1 Tax=Sparassis crispa TaxID=139825 RepID=A0A401GMW3_9APHY|nr:hypothetical protein SCP_0505730 [Sparassis crispa]GBE83520.1 hypothetical protein SCP_0505730 [Sparassis crispa]